MTKRIIAITLLLLTSSAGANINCGLKPLKPLGCSSKAYATCQCDQYGNCQWVWVGC